VNCSPTTRIFIVAAFAFSTSVRTRYAYVQSPTSRIAGTAVQITSRRVLPWIGGPSSCSSPGRMRNFQTEKRTIVMTSTKIGTDTISSTSHSVSIGFA
jgi:hypothetical protein